MMSPIILHTVRFVVIRRDRITHHSTRSSELLLLLQLQFPVVAALALLTSPALGVRGTRGILSQRRHLLTQLLLQLVQEVIVVRSKHKDKETLLNRRIWNIYIAEHV